LLPAKLLVRRVPKDGLAAGHALAEFLDDHFQSDWFFDVMFASRPV
jgi:hypothetical protein